MEIQEGPEDATFSFGDLAFPRRLCFNWRDLLASDFEVGPFVSSLRMKTPLSTIQKDLERILEWIESEIVGLIDKDYSKFIGVSRSVSEIGTQLERASEPLSALSTSLDAVLRRVRSSITRLEDLVSRQTLLIRREWAVKRNEATAEKAKLLTSTIRKIESLSSSPEYSPSKQDRILVQRATDLLVALSVHFALIPSDYPSSVDSETVEELAQKTKEILDHHFTHAVKTNDHDVLLYCLRGYIDLDLQEHAETKYARLFVQPAFEKFFKGSSDSVEFLVTFVDRCRKFLNQECRFVLDILNETDDLQSHFSFVAKSIWPTFVSMLLMRMSKIFSPGIPDKFQTNFSLCYQFQRDMENLCPCLESVEALRAHPLTQELWSRWNCGAYYQLRFQEITATCKSILSMDSVAPFVSTSKLDSTAFRTVLFHNIFATLRRCFDDDIFIFKVGSRFFSLSLQIVNAFGHWILEHILAPKKTHTDEREEVKGESLSMEIVTDLRGDVDILSKRVEKDLIPRIITQWKIEGEHQKKVELTMKDTMKEWTIRLSEEFSRHVVDRISPQCLSPLKAIRGMPGMFRASQRDMPTSPSFFVAKMFAPLQDIVPSPPEYGWMEATLQFVTAKYVEMTQEMLRSVRKTDESLRKLLSHRKAISGSGSSGAAIGSGSAENLETSDSAKIQKQLELDALSFGEHLEALGIPEHHIPQYQEFKDLAKSSDLK